MKSMFLLMNVVAENFSSYFKNKSDNDMVEVEIKDVLTRYGNDVIASVVFGVEVDSLKNRENLFYLMLKEATNVNRPELFLKIMGYSLIPKLFEVRVSQVSGCYSTTLL